MVFNFESAQDAAAAALGGPWSASPVGEPQPFCDSARAVFKGHSDCSSYRRVSAQLGLVDDTCAIICDDFPKKKKLVLDDLGCSALY